VRSISLIPCVLPAIFGLAISAHANEMPALKDIFADAWQMGVALREEIVRDEGDALQALATHHFDIITPENELKWGIVQASEGSFNFAPADAIADFARARGMSMIGHAFIWHEMGADWVFEDNDGAPAPPEIVQERLKQHMTALIERYGDVVRGWDVVNEAVSENKNEYLRDTNWRRALGDDYVATAFQLAAELAPDAELYYNDYNLDLPHKRDKTVRLVKDMLDRGIRVDAIGMQSHYSLRYPRTKEIERSIQAFSSLGVRVHITELDVSLYSFFDRRDRYRDGAPPQLLEEQAARYATLFQLYLDHRNVIDRVTVWGLHDAQSWLNYTPVADRPDYPLLFHADGQPKPAFHAVVETGLKARPYSGPAFRTFHTAPP